MHKALAEVVEDFGLLSFLPLDISSAESVARVLAKIDKCNGYVFVVNQNNTIPNESKTEEGSTSPGGTNNASHHDLFQCAIQTDSMYETLADIQERLSASREQIKKKEQEGRDPKQTASSIGTFKSR